MPKKKYSVILLAYGEMGHAALCALLPSCEILSIITPPKINETVIPVEQEAQKNNIEILQTNSNTEIEKAIKHYLPDTLVICSYNKILPASTLNLTKCINVHHGNLPKFRGRANFNWAIILGKKKLEVTIHEAVPDLDAGNIYASFPVAITPHSTIATLYDRINDLLIEHLGKTVIRILNGYSGTPQKGTPTYCSTRLPEDGYIDWQKTSVEIDRLIRSVGPPYPGAFTYFNKNKMIVLSAIIPKNAKTYVGRIPGRVIAIHKQMGVEVLTGDSSIIIQNIIINGKKQNASQVIKTVKVSLGIDFVKLFDWYIEYGPKN